MVYRANEFFIMDEILIIETGEEMMTGLRNLLKNVLHRCLRLGRDC